MVEKTALAASYARRGREEQEQARRASISSSIDQPMRLQPEEPYDGDMSQSHDYERYAQGTTGERVVVPLSATSMPTQVQTPGGASEKWPTDDKSQLQSQTQAAEAAGTQLSTQPSAGAPSQAAYNPNEFRLANEGVIPTVPLQNYNVDRSALAQWVEHPGHGSDGAGLSGAGDEKQPLPSSQPEVAQAGGVPRSGRNSPVLPAIEVDHASSAESAGGTSRHSGEISGTLRSLSPPSPRRLSLLLSSRRSSFGAGELLRPPGQEGEPSTPGALSNQAVQRGLSHQSSVQSMHSVILELEQGTVDLGQDGGPGQQHVEDLPRYERYPTPQASPNLGTNTPLQSLPGSVASTPGLPPPQMFYGSSVYASSAASSTLGLPLVAQAPSSEIPIQDDIPDFEPPAYEPASGDASSAPTIHNAAAQPSRPDEGANDSGGENREAGRRE